MCISLLSVRVGELRFSRFWEDVTSRSISRMEGKLETFVSGCIGGSLTGCIGTGIIRKIPSRNSQVSGLGTRLSFYTS